MSHENTHVTNEQQDDAHRLDELSDEALDDLISKEPGGSFAPWDKA